MSAANQANDSLSQELLGSFVRSTWGTVRRPGRAYHARMSEQNGSAPAPVDTPTDEPCVDCASNGEKVLAVLGLAFALLVAVMAIDMFTGGKVTGYVVANKGGGGD